MARFFFYNLHLFFIYFLSKYELKQKKLKQNILYNKIKFSFSKNGRLKLETKKERKNLSKYYFNGS